MQESHTGLDGAELPGIGYDQANTVQQLSLQESGCCGIGVGEEPDAGQPVGLQVICQFGAVYGWGSENLKRK